MRALISYGLAGVVLLAAAAWFATGTLVTGGNGPGNGHTQILSMIEGEDHGPIAAALGEVGMIAEHHGTTEFDPRLTIAQRNETRTGESVQLQSVRTRVFLAQPLPIEVPLRGTTRAKATVSAVAETAGIVDIVHVGKGEAVEIGDALCTLDQGTRVASVAQAEAGLAQAQAGLTQAQLDFDTNADLRQRGLAPANSANSVRVGLEAARAQLSSAEAALDNARAELDRTKIVARVAGIVQDPLALEGSMLQMGSPCATIIQLNPILFSANIPEVHIGRARIGLDAVVRTVTGTEAEGKVTFISATADNATRSFPAEIEIPNPDHEIRDGMTASAVVTLGTAPAHLLPQSVLALDDDGALGVRTVQDGTVAFYPVTILSDTREGVWVSGLPVRAEVITVGQEFVTAGQQVDASPEPTATDAASAQS